MNYEKLLSPLSFGGVTVKNRIVMPPLVIWKADKTAEVTEAHLNHYRMSAGPGLIIVEATVISPEGRLRETQLGIFDDRQLDGLSRLTDVIHEGGGAASIQIHHAGGKATPAFNYGLTPLVPSKAGVNEDKVCTEMSIDDIKRTQDNFAAAAVRAEQSGFDIIELHGAHGYLISQFLSPLTNKRTDAYGGSLENRQRFLIETFTAVKAAVSGKSLISCRLGIADGKSDGLTVNDGVATAVLLEKLGMPLLDISCAHSVRDSIVPEGSNYSSLMHLAQLTKEAVSIPVIGVGGIKRPEQAEAALTDGMADLIAVGKGLLADPGWAVKLEAGKPETINECINCKICFCFKNLNNCPVRKKSGIVLA